MRHALKQNPNAKICILYEDNDWGRDYTDGVRDVLGARYAATVREATYEFTDASIDRKIVKQGHRLRCADRASRSSPSRRSAGPRSGLETDVLHEQYLGLSAHRARAGRARESIGLLSSAYGKDPRDPAFENDPAIKRLARLDEKVCRMRMCA